MSKHFLVNDDLFHAENPYVRQNTFIGQRPDAAPLPTYAAIRDRLPVPVWDGHEDAVRCYDKAWQLAFGNLCQPTPGTGFVSNFIDTAFNGCLFMWDSSFIVLFGKYAERIFPFQKERETLFLQGFAGISSDIPLLPGQAPLPFAFLYHSAPVRP